MFVVLYWLVLLNVLCNSYLPVGITYPKPIVLLRNSNNITKVGRVVHFHTANIVNIRYCFYSYPTEVTLPVSLALKVTVTVEVITAELSNADV